MIVKRSGRNQIALPKKLVQAAGLGDEDIYFDVQYASGCFILKPLQFEEKIPRESLERFKRKALAHEPQDRRFPTMDELIASLDRPVSGRHGSRTRR